MNIGWDGSATMLALPGASGVHLPSTATVVYLSPVTAVSVTAPANVNWTTATANLPGWVTVCDATGSIGDQSGCGNGTFWLKATSKTCPNRSVSLSNLICGSSDTIVITQIGTCDQAANPPCAGTITVVASGFSGGSGFNGSHTLTFNTSTYGQPAYVGPGGFGSFDIRCDGTASGWLVVGSAGPGSYIPTIGGSGSTACCPAPGTYSVTFGARTGTFVVS